MMISLGVDAANELLVEDCDYTKDLQFCLSLMHQRKWANKLLIAEQALLKSYTTNIPIHLSILLTLMDHENNKALSTIESYVNSQPRSGYIYLIGSDHGTKIGRSKKPVSRVSQIQAQMPFGTNFIFSFAVNDMYYFESMLHKKYNSSRMNGEWFNLTIKNIDNIKSTLEKEQDGILYP